jgi:hypothetical protein
MSSSDIIAICSVVIAVLAFIVTAWQAWLAYNHNRLSVLPLLVWHISRDRAPEGAFITYSVKNLGLGPAVIKDRYFTKDGVRFESPVSSTDEVRAFLEFTLGNALNYQLRVFGLPGRGAAIPSQGEVVIAKIHFPHVRSEWLATFKELAGDINFHVRYESMYRQSFEFDAINGTVAV